MFDKFSKKVTFANIKLGADDHFLFIFFVYCSLKRQKLHCNLNAKFYFTNCTAFETSNKHFINIISLALKIVTTC